MASFLRNTGDIVLDAVLTDYGRKLLAKGDGSFKVVKFAFGDDEIDYGLFKTGSTTILQDKDIMNTPILEAFTNNYASMKSQLLTLAADNILFLPVMKLFTEQDANKIGNFSGYQGYIIPVDVINTANNKKTSDFLTGSTDTSVLQGVLNVSGRHMRVDQGLDSSDLNSDQNLKDISPMMYETEYNIYVDNRFCSIGMINTDNTRTILQPMGVDDDDIAVYKLTEQISTNTSFVQKLPVSTVNGTADTNTASSIKGTRGSMLKFNIIPNEVLMYTNTMFNKYGKTMSLNSINTSVEFHTIRMPVRIVGATTGYMLETSILFAKVK